MALPVSPGVVEVLLSQACESTGETPRKRTGQPVIHFGNSVAEGMQKLLHTQG